MRRLILLFLLLTGLLFGSSMTAWTQTYDISWYKIAGGGGTSTGGVYTVSGTIGQPDAGNLAGGAYAITGGFWGIVAAVQIPGSPLLTIAAAANNRVVLAWPSAFSGFVLQQDSTLANTNWVAVNTNTFPIVVNNGTNTVTVPLSGNLFFRLSHP